MRRSRCWPAAEAGPLDELQRARVDLLRGQIASADRRERGSGAAAEGGQAARAARPGAGARDLPRGAGAQRCSPVVWRAAAICSTSSRAARAAPPPRTAPRPSDLLLDGLAELVTEGRAAAAPALRRAVSAFRGDGSPWSKGFNGACWPSSAAVELWDFESWDAVITRQMELARDAGALAPLSIALNGEGIVVTGAATSPRPARVIVEADAVTEATGTRIAPYGGLLLAALRGREDEAGALIDATIKDATAGGEGLAVQYAQWTTAILYNGLGRYEEALAAAQQASEVTPELFIAVWALPELIEAAIRSGNADLAPAALERLVEQRGRQRHRLGAGDRGAFAGAAQRRRGRRGLATPRRSIA